MKNRKGNLLMTLGLVLILAALALVGYNQWDASRAQQIGRASCRERV